MDDARDAVRDPGRELVPRGVVGEAGRDLVVPRVRVWAGEADGPFSTVRVRRAGGMCSGEVENDEDRFGPLLSPQV